MNGLDTVTSFEFEKSEENHPMTHVHPNSQDKTTPPISRRQVVGVNRSLMNWKLGARRNLVYSDNNELHHDVHKLQRRGPRATTYPLQ